MTANECCNLCGANQLCMGFNFNIINGQCIFKGTGVGETPGLDYANYIAGVILIRWFFFIINYQ